MSADYENMLAKLQMQLAQSTQAGPSFMGLQAQQDPNTTAALLKKLQDQQYVNEQGNNGGQWGFLANAGQKDFARAGQNIGNMLGVGTPPHYDNSNVMAQRQALASGQGQLTSALQQGTDPLQARVAVLSKLAESGVPGAADALSKAQDDLIKTQGIQQKTAELAAQAKNYQNTDERAREKEDREKLQNTWSDDPSVKVDPYHEAQVNGLGEKRTIVKGYQPNATAMNAAAASDPGTVNYIAEFMKAHNGNPPSNMKNPQAVTAAIRLLATQGDAGDIVAGTIARTAQDQSDKGALANTQKTLSATTAYLSTMDKNMAKAQEAAKQLDFGNVKKLNQAYQAWLSGTSDPEFAKYNIYFSSVASEFAKIKSGSFGNTAVAEPLQKQAMEDLNKTAGGLAPDALFDAVRTEGQNRVASLKDEVLARASDIANRRTNVGKPSASAPAVAPPPSAASSPPPAGWTLHQDAKGNKAYVSPDGKQFQEVK